MHALPTTDSGRIHTVDFLRGITIFGMIFANLGFADSPWYMKHYRPLEAFYGATWVDFIFPMFLLLVGVSIPAAFRKYDPADVAGRRRMWLHIVLRTASLLGIGVLILNTPSPARMGDWGLLARLGTWSGVGAAYTAQNWWQLIAMGGVILFFQTTRSPERRDRRWSQAMRWGGAVLLAVYLIVYRNASGGWLRTGWWEIIGVIGWGYFFGSLYYLGVRRNPLLLALLLPLLIGLTVAGDAGHWREVPVLGYFYSKLGCRTVLVVLGILLYEIREQAEKNGRASAATAGYCLLALLAAGVFAPLYGISKQRGTVSWMLLAAAFAALLWLLVHPLCDGRERRPGWVDWFCELGSVPLTAYLFQFFCLFAAGGFRSAALSLRSAAQRVERRRGFAGDYRRDLCGGSGLPPPRLDVETLTRTMEELVS